MYNFFYHWFQMNCVGRIPFYHFQKQVNSPMCHNLVQHWVLLSLMLLYIIRTFFNHVTMNTFWAHGFLLIEHFL